MTISIVIELIAKGSLVKNHNSWQLKSVFEILTYLNKYQFSKVVKIFKIFYTEPFVKVCPN